MFEKFSDRCRRAFGIAKRLSDQNGHDLKPEHAVYGIMYSGVGVALKTLTRLRTFSGVPVNLQGFFKELSALIDTGNPESPAVTAQCVQRAIELSRTLESNYIETHHIIMAILENTELTVTQIFRKYGVTQERFSEESGKVIDQLQKGQEQDGLSADDLIRP